MGQTMPWREGGRKKAVSRRKKSTCEFCVHLVYEPKREIKNKKMHKTCVSLTSWLNSMSRKVCTRQINKGNRI